MEFCLGGPRVRSSYEPSLRSEGQADLQTTALDSAAHQSPNLSYAMIGAHTAAVEEGQSVYDQ
jgi:hypothetical protein